MIITNFERIHITIYYDILGWRKKGWDVKGWDVSNTRLGRILFTLYKNKL